MQQSLRTWTTNGALLGVLGLGYASCALFSVEKALASDELREQLRCIEIAFSHAAETRDTGFFASFIDKDARFISDTVRRGPLAIVQAWSPFFAEHGPEIKWRPYYVEIPATGNVAFSRGPYRTRGTGEDGQVVESWGIYNSVWRLGEEGSWTVLFDAGNPGEPQLNDEMKVLIDRPVTDCDVEAIRKDRLSDRGDDLDKVE